MQIDFLLTILESRGGFLSGFECSMDTSLAIFALRKFMLSIEMPFVNFISEMSAGMLFGNSKSLIMIGTIFFFRFKARRISDVYKRQILMSI